MLTSEENNLLEVLTCLTSEEANRLVVLTSGEENSCKC